MAHLEANLLVLRGLRGLSAYSSLAQILGQKLKRPATNLREEDYEGTLGAASSGRRSRHLAGTCFAK